jgi:hypothetical protein
MAERCEMNSTDTIAIYAAVLATAVAAYDGYVGWKSRQPNIRVEVSEGATHMTELGDWSAHRIFVQAYNRGQKTVNFTMVGIILPDGQKLAIPYPLGCLTLPCELMPERSCQAELAPNKLAQELRAMGFAEKVSLVGYYNDAVGRRHTSKPAIFDTVTEKLAK